MFDSSLRSLLLVAASFGAVTATAPGSIYRNTSYSPLERAEDLLQLLTWEEKIGQMGGVRRLLGANCTFNRTAYDATHELQNGILGYGVQLNDPYDVLPIANQIRQEQANSSKVPYITVTDSVNGPYLEGGSLFPPTLSLASTFNVPLYKKAVAAIRDENMALGTHWVLGPEVDVGKEPRYGRVGETYGEDVFVAGVFGTEYIKTMQEKDENGYVKIATTIKHFVYGQPLGGINTASQYGGLNYLFNDLMPPFIKAIREAHPMSIMISYATIDKIPMSENKYMQQVILRDKLNFTGVHMSDAFGLSRLHDTSLTASSYAQAALKSLRAGVQLELAPGAPAVFPTLVNATDDAQVRDLVDAAVLAILQVKFATGTFDLPLPTLDGLNATLRAPAHLDANRNISREAIVLLQNQNHTLPPPATGKVALLGPYATIIDAGSYAAQNSTDRAFGRSLLESMQATFGASNVVYERGCDFLSTNDSSGIQPAVDAAKAAGLAVVNLGSLSVNTEDPLMPERTDGEFFTHADLGFPGLQQTLLDAVLDAGVPTVLVLTGGQAFVLQNSTLQRAGAILHGFLAGEYTADSVVEILTGAVNPSGKLPISLPQHNGAFPIYYNYLPSDEEAGWSFPQLTHDPPMPFGYGLSYTTFNVSAPTVARAADGSWDVAVRVANTGDVDGQEVVQVYVRKPYTDAIETPVKQLVGFTKVAVPAGGAEEVLINVPQSELGFYLDGVWLLEEGVRTFFVGSSSRLVDLQSVNVTVTAT